MAEPRRHRLRFIPKPQKDPRLTAALEKQADNEHLHQEAEKMARRVFADGPGYYYGHRDGRSKANPMMTSPVQTKAATCPECGRTKFRMEFDERGTRLECRACGFHWRESA